MAGARERGLALIAVLWGLVLLSVIGLSIATTTRTEVRLARNLVENARARALAEAGVNRVILGLVDVELERQLRVDGTPYRFAFAGGEVLVSVQDEAGKIDLNRAPDGVLKGLFVAVGLREDESAALVDAIVDFRDTNDLRRLNGAEDPDYLAEGRIFGAKDRPFEATEELRQVLGMTPELYAQVAPALSVHSRRRRVDRDTAPPLVLRALPGLDPAELDERLAAREEREERAEEDAEEIGSIGPQALGPVETRGPVGQSRVRVLTVRAEARTEGGALYVREAVVRLNPSGDRPFRIQAWKQGEQAAYGTEAD